MRTARILLAAVLAVALGVLWPDGPAAVGLAPDLALALSVAAGLAVGGTTGLWTGVACGLLAAPLTLEPVFLDAALLGAAGHGAMHLRRWVREDRPRVQAAVAGVLALTLGLVRVARLEAAGYDPAAAAWLPALLLGALATAVVTPLLAAALAALGLFARGEDEVRRVAVV